MSDRYQGFVSTPIGRLLVKNLGLPNPTRLERWHDGAPLVDGVVVIGGEGRLAGALPMVLDDLGIASTSPTASGPRHWSSTPPASPTRPGWSRSSSSSRR